MRTAIKPKITKRMDFTLPYGVAHLRRGEYNRDTYQWEYKYESDEDAIKARSFNWYPDELYGVSIHKVKDKFLFLIGENYDEGDPVELGAEVVKLTTGIVRRMLNRALKSDPGKVFLPDETETTRKTKYGPKIERLTQNHFLFTAPCGFKAILAKKTIENMLEAIKVAEKELK